MAGQPRAIYGAARWQQEGAATRLPPARRIVELDPAEPSIESVWPDHAATVARIMLESDPTATLAPVGIHVNVNGKRRFLVNVGRGVYFAREPRRSVGYMIRGLRIERPAASFLEPDECTCSATELLCPACFAAAPEIER